MKINNKSKLIIALLGITLITSGCSKLGFGKKDKGQEGPSTKTVEITPAYLSEEASYRAAKMMADKYSIDFSDEAILNYVESNYSTDSDKSNPRDLLNSISVLKRAVGDKGICKAYAQVYVNNKIKEQQKSKSSNISPEEMERYKTDYKDYLDRLGIPEEEREQYIIKLKEAYEGQQKLDSEMKAALDEASKEVLKEYAPDTVK